MNRKNRGRRDGGSRSLEARDIQELIAAMSRIPAPAHAPAEAAHRGSVDVSRISLSSVMVVGLCVFLVYGTIQITAQYDELKYQVTTIDAQLRTMAQSLAALKSDTDTGLEDLKARVAEIESARWSSISQAQWCRNAEQENSEINWRCP